jgi:hypothetical protein
LAAIIDGKGGDTVAIEVRITCGDIVGSGVVIGISGVNCPDDCTVRTGFRNAENSIINHWGTVNRIG